MAENAQHPDNVVGGEAPESRPRSRGNSPEYGWQDLFGDDFRPLVHVHLTVAPNDTLTVAWKSEKSKLADEFANDLVRVLEKDAAWDTADWHRAMGTEPCDWVNRVILLCQFQLKARTFPAKNVADKFVVLHDGQVVSARLFWPRYPPRDKTKLNNPLTRLPESVTLYALNELFHRERSLPPGGDGKPVIWSDQDLAVELTQWLREHGASEAWLRRSEDTAASETTTQSPVSGKDISNFRDKSERHGLEGLLPTERDRRRAADAAANRS